MALLLLALLYFVYTAFIMRKQQQAAPDGFHADTASSLRILDERLARGDITPEEFERIRTILRS